MTDFANLLFSGPCNARCPFCIGQQLIPALKQNNLNLYPPHNLDSWIELIHQHSIRQVVLTGSDTDPQLYQHEALLLAHLRKRLPTGTQFSLHTNGLLALKKIDTFNQYDRVTISLPSFNPQTYHRMMGRRDPPDLEGILSKAKVPVKISCAIDKYNRDEMPDFLAGCARMGIRRVVVRKLFGEAQSWSELLPWKRLNLVWVGTYRDNPVYEANSMQVTLWDFQTSTSTSINLFSSGHISKEYLLTRSV